MPEISLNDYFAKLNSLLSSGAADEVIQNSRHILQYYPKNVTAARFLGRALVANGAWQEGRETLRRVLSVIPDDYAAHLGLSEANERMNRPDEAIWHLERAFEQRPNDKELIDALRGLYRRHRKIDNLKIQLTSATVARQYLRSGAYTQAIDALRGALARMNDRLDLKLLLAQTLWQQGAQEEAAEIALEVLKILPDCLEANKIMAQLWLGENRPSDAQRYVNHLEGVDPYLAVELVQGEPPDDDAFRVEELDYARTAQSQMTSARPDWLREISSAASAPEEAEQPAGELSDWASAMLGPQTPPQTAQAAKQPPAAAQGSASARFAAMSKRDDAPGLTDIFGKPDETSTGELSALFDTPPGEEDPMAWLHDTGVEIVDDEEPSFKNLFDDNDTALPEDEHPLAWLKDANSDLLVDDEPPAADDAFAWVNAESRPAAPSQGTDEDEEPLSWLQGDALLNEALDLDEMADESSPDRATQRMKIPGAPSSKPEQAEGKPVEAAVPGPRRGLTAMLQEANFDWANKKEENVVSDDEMDDWLNQFGATEPRKAVSESPDWLNDLDQPEMSSLESDEWFKTEDAAPTPEIVVPEALMRLDSTDDEDEDSDWLAEFAPQDETPAGGDSIGDAEFEWQPPAAPPEPEPETPAEADVSEEIPDWLNALEPDDEEEAQPEAEEPAAEGAPEDDFAWMTEDDFTAAEGGATEEAIDWFAELEPKAASPETVPSQAAAPASPISTGDEVEPSAAHVPDWLADLQPSEMSLTEDEAAPEADAAWTPDASAEPEAPVSRMPGWLADIQAEAIQAEPESAAGGTDFAWMTVDEEPASEPEPAVSASDFAWMTEDEAPEDEFADQTETEAEPAETPDWLTALAPTEPAAASEPEPAVSASEFAWMTEDEAPTEDQVEPAEAGESPDWLSALAPSAAASEPAAVSASDFAWMAEDETPEDEFEAEPEAEPVETPDWLSALAPPEPAAASEPEPAVGASDFAWMTEDETPEDEFEAEPEAEPVETPDWLAALAPAEPAAANEPAAVGASDFAWLTEDETPEDEFEDQGEAEAEPAETPDWLAAVAPQTSKPAAQLDADSNFDWMTTDTSPDEFEAEPEAADEVSEPDWLGELGLPEQPEEEAEPELAGADITWTSDELQPPAADARADAVAEIDWLDELEPVAEADEAEFTADEIEPADEFSWLDEAEAPAAEPQAEAQPPAVELPAAEPQVEAQPLAAELPAAEPEAEAQPVMALAEDAKTPLESAENVQEAEAAEDEEEILEPAPAQNAPDWLNAMVPGLDVDYEAAGEPITEEVEAAKPAAAPAKREFDWLVEMVEEETTAAENARFIFSRPPVWLERTNGATHGDVVDDDLPDWPSDDADADVPEWLR